MNQCQKNNVKGPFCDPVSFPRFFPIYASRHYKFQHSCPEYGTINGARFTNVTSESSENLEISLFGM